MGTHSKTPEGKDKPGVFPDGAYVQEYMKIANEVQERVAREIDRLNSILEQEMKLLRDRSLSTLSTRLDSASKLWQELMSISGASTFATGHILQLHRQSIDATLSQEQRAAFVRELQQHQCSDTSVPFELRKCAAEVLHLANLERVAKERLRRVCGIRDGSSPPADATPVSMRLILIAKVDSSNLDGVSELKHNLAFCCRGLPFIGERVPQAWIRVDAAIDKLEQQSLSVAEGCHEILKIMELDMKDHQPSSKLKLADSDVMDALEFWSQLGRVFVQDGQLFPQPKLVVDLMRPLVHHKPMNLLYDTERMGLLKQQSLQPSALFDEARQHLQMLTTRNEVDEDFLKNHVLSWAQMSQEQVKIMLDFFVSSALLSKIENRQGAYLVAARLRNLPSIQQLLSPSETAHVGLSAGALTASSEMQERLEISAARDDMMRLLRSSLQPMMAPSHCAAQVLALLLGSSATSDHRVSSTLCVRVNEAFFLLPIRHVAVLARLQARMVQTQPRGVSLEMHMFSDGVLISRGNSLCGAIVRNWRSNERAPQLRHRALNLDCILHVASNDDGMIRFMSRCIEGIIETAFAGLRYECWCPIRDQYGTTVDWMQFEGCGGHAVQESLSSILETKNMFDVVFDGKQLNQLFAIRCPVFISHAWSDGTFHFVKRLKHYIESMALASVWCDFLQMDQKQGEVEVQFRDGLCKASVILVCLTPRYLTRPNCLRELKWSLDFAYKAHKDVRILPLHPALTFTGIAKIMQHRCVCVANADGTHKVHKLSEMALKLLQKMKQNMCLNWSELDPWASDAFGDLWSEQMLAADGKVLASMVSNSSPLGLVNELVSKIASKVGFNDAPSSAADCLELDDKDLESSVIDDADVPTGLIDSYPEVTLAFKQRVADCSDKKKLFEDAVKGYLKSTASGVAAPFPLTSTVASATLAITTRSIDIRGVYVKSKSHTFPLLSRSTRFVLPFLFDISLASFL